MKFMARKQIYQASNVTFNPKTCEAFSYGWWRFVGLVDGFVIFNDYNYSSSTIKHQYKVRQLMEHLGIAVDFYMKLPDGIISGQSLKTLKTVAREHLKQVERDNEVKRLRRNEKAREKRRMLRDQRITNNTILVLNEMV